MKIKPCWKPVLALLLAAPMVCRPQSGPNPFAESAQAAEEGGKLFAISCATCHGRNGEGGRGPDLSRGVFNAGRRDEDLFHVISQGVAGSEMISYQPLGTDQIWRLVTFIRTLSRSGAAQSASAAAGEALFWGKGDCGRCHQIESKGVSFGPDLTRGRRVTPQKLKTAIVAPDDDITPGYAVVTVVTRDKKTISGLQRFYDNFSARLIDAYLALRRKGIIG